MFFDTNIHYSMLVYICLTAVVYLNLSVLFLFGCFRIILNHFGTFSLLFWIHTLNLLTLSFLDWQLRGKFCNLSLYEVCHFLLYPSLILALKECVEIKYHTIILWVEAGYCINIGSRIQTGSYGNLY